VLPDERKRYLGHSDPPLDAKGLDQAKRLADDLRAVPFAAAYSSDLQRARTTAEIILAGRGLEVQLEFHLREIDSGRWEGLAAEEVDQRYPREAAERDRDPLSFRFPGGESYRDLSEEVVPLFEHLLATALGDLLIVAHKGVNRVILCHYLGWPLERLYSIPQDYACVSTVQVMTAEDGTRGLEVHIPGLAPAASPQR
jgi:broad specificity phosphatase PhoE